jgi:uncharacterized protein YjiS (DUF1127 family)
LEIKTILIIHFMECFAGCKHRSRRPKTRRAVSLAGPGRRRAGRSFDMSLWSLEFQRASAGRHLWRAAHAIHSAWMRYLRHRQRQCDLAQLAAMNDFELKDIGISRDQIRAALREGTDLRSASR